MKKIIVLLPLLLLACAKETVISKQNEAIKNQIETIKKTLPEECKTEAVLSQIKVLESQVDTELMVCEKSLKDLEDENKMIKTNVIILISVIILVILGRSW